MRGMASYRSRLQSAPSSYDEVFQDRSVNITLMIVFFQEKGIQKFFIVWAVFMCVPLLNTRGHSHQSNSCSHQTKRCYKLDRQHLGPPWYRLEKAWLWRMFLTLAQVFFFLFFFLFAKFVISSYQRRFVAVKFVRVFFFVNDWTQPTRVNQFKAIFS